MDPRPIGFLLGILLASLTAGMLTVGLVSVVLRDGEWRAFMEATAWCAFISGLTTLTLRQTGIALGRRQSFLLTSLAWTLVPLFGALPLAFSHLPISLTDAVFESISGMTTTGSTVLTGLDHMAPSLLLWRAMLQWLGGIGIVAMGIAILPFLRVGGLQLFRTESSDRSDKVVARVDEFAALLLAVYVGLTVLCGLAYYAAGMDEFEAICHAMTTISTGGYSTSDASMGHFGPAVQWVGTVFMLCGGLPFVLFVQALRGRPLMLIKDGQVLTLLALLSGSSLVLAAWLVVQDGVDWLEAIRLSSFSVTSIVTTTGYADSDYTTWGTFAIMVFVFLTFVGGCAGSTAGGFKIYRIQIVLEMLRVVGARLTTPHGVFVAKYAGKPIDNDIIHSVATFMIAFFLTVFVFTVALGMVGLDFETAFSGAATAVANVGPGIGRIIGPSGTFASLPDVAKWLLCLAMILGRLEIVTMLVIATPYFWRQ